MTRQKSALADGGERRMAAAGDVVKEALEDAEGVALDESGPGIVGRALVRQAEALAQHRLEISPRAVWHLGDLVQRQYGAATVRGGVLAGEEPGLGGGSERVDERSEIRVVVRRRRVSLTEVHDSLGGGHVEIVAAQPQEQMIPGLDVPELDEHARKRRLEDRLRRHRHRPRKENRYRDIEVDRLAFDDVLGIQKDLTAKPRREIFIEARKSQFRGALLPEGFRAVENIRHRSAPRSNITLGEHPPGEDPPQQHHPR
jgi:hypothetical protein